MITQYCLVDGSPTNVSAVTLSPHSIEVTWDPPAVVDEVTGYAISYDGVEVFANDGSVSVNRSTNRAIINGLEEFIRYDITVQAVYNTINVPSSSVRVMTLSDGKLYITTFLILLMYFIQYGQATRCILC